MQRIFSRLFAALVLWFGFAASALGEEVKYTTSPATGKVLSIDVPFQGGDDPSPSSEARPASAPSSSTSTPQLRAAAPAPMSFVSGRSPVETAQNFVNRYGKAFGLSDASKEMEVSSEESDSLGMSHVRFKQTFQGIPVFGAELIAHVDAGGEVKSLSGAVGSNLKVPAKTKVPLWKAASIATQAFRDKYPKVKPEVKESKLYILQPGLVRNSRDITSYLVWDIRLAADPQPIDEDYFVDVVTGEVRQTLDNIRHLNRKVYDCSSKPGTNLCSANITLTYNQEPDWVWTPPPTSYTFGCGEGLCPRGPNPRYPDENSLDTDTLYGLLGDVHNYYFSKFGRNGANGMGGNNDGSQAPNITSNMDTGRTYMNFIGGWGTDCMDAIYTSDMGPKFCKGVVVSDVVGHEYSHGVLNNLTYIGQSGALSENYSDVIGEMFEYWKVGTSDWINGALVITGGWRNLAEPSLSGDPGYPYPHPDRFYSPDVVSCNGSLDSGGVHINSTIPSKALYLASMGGVFNGCSIAAISREKVEQILYRAKTVYYVSSESFELAYRDLRQSCTDLYGAGSSDCSEFTKALQAVEMDQAGLCADPTGALKHPASCRVQPDCTNLIYHPGYNPSEPTIDDRRNFCLSIGFKWAGLIFDSFTATYHWYGNCRPDADKDYPSWNTDPGYTMDLSECGPPPPVLCNDSDGGVVYDEYFTKGRTGKTESGPYFDEDYCQLGGDTNSPSRAFYADSCSGADSNCNLIERKCGALGGTHQAYHCPNGCSGGRCS